MRRTVLIVVAATGLAAGIVGLAGSATRAMAETAGAGSQPLVEARQAAPVATCPFAEGAGMPAHDAMRVHMEPPHGTTAMGGMWGWMAGEGGASGMGGAMGGMMGAGAAVR